MARKARLLGEARDACKGALAPRFLVSNDERPRWGAGPFWGGPQSITVRPLARVSRQPTVIVSRLSSACYGSIIPMGDRAAIAGRGGTMVAHALFQSHELVTARLTPLHFARPGIFSLARQCLASERAFLPLPRSGPRRGRSTIEACLPRSERWGQGRQIAMDGRAANASR